jgi:hypothetical protein
MCGWLRSARCRLEQLGRKFDQDKPRLELLPPLALIEVSKVLTEGAKKYAVNNWKHVPDLQNRYTGAALRHILAEMSGEEIDRDFNLPHMAHAICCLMFKLEDYLEKRNEGQRPREAVGQQHLESDGPVRTFGIGY